MLVSVPSPARLLLTQLLTAALTTSSAQHRNSHRISELTSTYVVLDVLRVAVKTLVTATGRRLNQPRVNRWVTASCQAGPAIGRAMPTNVRVPSPLLISTPLAEAVARVLVDASTVMVPDDMNA